MTDESQTLARELVAVTQTVEKSIVLMRKMLDKMTDAGVSLDMIIDVQALREHLEHAGVQTYAEVFTESEMRAGLAFYTSPLGQTIQAKQPLVEQRIIASLEAYLPTAMRLGNES